MEYRIKLYDMQDRERFFMFEPKDKATQIIEKVDSYMDCKSFAFAVGLLTFVFVILPVFGG